ncbi:MAG: aminotransferase class V-fold PLP-dependent enzyme, partial [Eggerthellaceae bacterium]
MAHVYLYPDEQGVISPEMDAEWGRARRSWRRRSVQRAGHREPHRRAGAAGARHGGCLVVDGAQSVPHMKVDVQALGCDFFAFSAHKAFGPFGMGVLWGRHELLEAMPPFLTGGEMIDSVTEQDAQWAPVPEKFEAGTQDAAGIYATAAAIAYM